MQVLNQVLTLFIIAIVGLVLRSRKVLSDAVLDGLTSILLTVSLPATAISAFQSQLGAGMDIMADLLWMIIISAACHIICIALSFMVFKNVNMHKRAPLMHYLTFTNSGFMGYPVVIAAYGQTGLLYAVAFVFIVNLFLFTVGVWYYAGKEQMDIKQAFLNPCLIATIAGAALFLFNIKLPDIILNPLTMLGNLTATLSMLIVGARLHGISLADIADIKIWLLCIARMVALPLILWFTLTAFNITGMVRNVSFLLTMMPGAAINTMMAQKYKSDGQLAAKLVFLSTALSLVTIPLLILLI